MAGIHFSHLHEPPGASASASGGGGLGVLLQTSAELRSQAGRPSIPFAVASVFLSSSCGQTTSCLSCKCCPSRGGGGCVPGAGRLWREKKNLPTRPRFRGPQTSSPAQPSRWDPPVRRQSSARIRAFLLRPKKCPASASKDSSQSPQRQDPSPRDPPSSSGDSSTPLKQRQP